MLNDMTMDERDRIEAEMADVFRARFGLHHITCDTCVRYNLPNDMRIQNFSYPNPFTGEMLDFYVPRARAVAIRDRAPIVEIAGVDLETWAEATEPNLNVAHLDHIPEEAMQEPALLVVVSVDPMHTVMIDGTHRSWLRYKRGEPVIGYVLLPYHIPEIATTVFDVMKGIEVLNRYGLT